MNTRPSTHPLQTVAYESDLEMQERLAEHGYSKTKVGEVYMTRSLSEPIASPVVADGFVIRPFAGMPERETRAIVPNSAFGGFEGPSEWALNDIGYMFDFCYAINAIDIVAATTDGRIVSSAVVFYDPVTKLGEFDPVATHQQFQQQGLAKAAMLTGLHWLKGAGMETAVIRTTHDNVAAIATYQSIGYKIVDRLWHYEKLK
jgi:GNAT superfamily N-acetyltransferase